MLSGFELCPRWVPLINTKLFCGLQYGAKRRWKFKESGKKARSIKEFLAACEQKRKKRKNRTASVFWKNPSTGLRTTHSKYRPRKGHRASSVIPEAGELYLKFLNNLLLY